METTNKPEPSTQVSELDKKENYWKRFSKWAGEHKDTVTLITATASILFGTSTMLFGFANNHRANIEFDLKMRPYIVLEAVGFDTNYTTSTSTAYVITFRNVGSLPAQIISNDLNCNNQSMRIPENSSNQRSVVLGNNSPMSEVLILNNSEEKFCDYLMIYKMATNDSKLTYKTHYKFKHLSNQKSLLATDSSLE
jgi:hypothetical protein